MGIDLKPYLNSLIAYHKVDENNPNFVSHHSNSEYMIVSSNHKELSDLLAKNDLFSNIQN